MSHRNRIRLSVLFAVVSALSFTEFAHAGPFEDCLDDAGLALVTSSQSLLQVGSQWDWIFGAPNEYVSCDPPDGQFSELTAGGFKAAAGYVSSVGTLLTTAALSSPNNAGGAHARFSIDRYFVFEVIPDDPSSTTPVSIDILTRHRFGSVITDSSGTGSASNGLSVYHELRRKADQVYVGPTWFSQVPVADGAVVDLFHTVEVPVNTPLRLLADLEQRSDSNAGGGSGSGAAGANTAWTLEVVPEAGATVVFDLEWQLGLAHPQLDEVPEPRLGMGLLPLAMLAGRLAASARRRRLEASARRINSPGRRSHSSGSLHA